MDSTLSGAHIEQVSTMHQEPAFLTIAPSTAEDEPLMQALAAAEHMGELTGFETTLVAWDTRTSPHTLAGFCRIKIYHGDAYVNPLVTAPAYRKQGVGSALMRAVSDCWGEVSFVARGYAVPFYESIGSQRIDWDCICPEVASDCDDCSMLAGCNPTPMRYSNR